MEHQCRREFCSRWSRIPTGRDVCVAPKFGQSPRANSSCPRNCRPQLARAAGSIVRSVDQNWRPWLSNLGDCQGQRRRCACDLHQSSALATCISRANCKQALITTEYCNCWPGAKTLAPPRLIAQSCEVKVEVNSR